MLILNELLVTLMLVLPSPDKMVAWTINEVPTQIQIVHKNGLEVSYGALNVPCHTRPKTVKEMVFRAETGSVDECYLVMDINTPRFVRHPFYWFRIKEAIDKDDLEAYIK